MGDVPRSPGSPGAPLDLDAARARIRAALPAPGVETAELALAAGRILAEDVEAGWDLPASDLSSMDGFALRAADVRAASAQRPVRLALVRGEPGPGQACRLATGAPLPRGTDSVARQEDARAGEGWVELVEATPVGHDVRRAGSEARAGDRLFARGGRIDAQVVALLATFGRTRVQVARRPVVAILSVGESLVPADRAGPGAVVESNAHALGVLVAEAGAEPRGLGIVSEDPAAIAARLAPAMDGVDVAVTAGGASGDAGTVRAALDRLGFDVRVDGVALSPGKPAAFGLVGGRPVFVLPGNPASATFGFELLVRPALLAMQGHRGPSRPTVRGRLVSAIRKQPGMTDVVPGAASASRGGIRFAPAPHQGSASVTAVLGANALAVVPPEREGRAGDEVELLLLGAIAAAPAPPVLCVVGRSESGKTTLLERVIPLLVESGLTVGAVKHDAHRFQMDREGKDTWRLRRAGARAVAIASPEELAAIVSTSRPATLDEVVASLPGDLDLVLVEGYKLGNAPKIEAHRRGRPLLHRSLEMSQVVAVVTDDPEVLDGTRPVAAGVRVFAKDDAKGVAEFVKGWIGRT